jgi:uncharacterized protein (TIGR02246 family)
MDDEAIICRIFGQQTAASNRQDASTWSKDFAENAEFTNPFGIVFEGRQAIESATAEIFAGIFHDIREDVSIRRTGFLRPDVAIVATDSESEIIDRSPQPAPNVPDAVFHSRAREILMQNGSSRRIGVRQDTWILNPVRAQEP